MATTERQKMASMDVMEYVLNLTMVDMRLKHTADSATHEMPISACGRFSIFTSDAVVGSNGRCSETCFSVPMDMAVGPLALELRGGLRRSGKLDECGDKSEKVHGLCCLANHAVQVARVHRAASAMNASGRG
ncbi:unnamed protein product [Phytophthora lilii]|uniref:Unnamed protein product n=1 Tax=Phytophthora lilii TaxID=2077276 RepID=A0A9W6UBQ3_9STRA|nr:unnamed protein product [Phytophthora lilii]